MENSNALYEGKAKVLFETDKPNVLLQYFKDDATAFNGIKKGTIGGKGEVNCAVSTVMFKLLENEGVPTHFIERTGSQEMLVHRLDIILVEVVIRNIVAGSLSKRMGLEEGVVIPGAPIIELYYKRDDLNDPMINDEHVRCWELATVEELARMRELSLKVNALLVPFFAERSIRLVDFKLEFGRTADGTILLGDEITPDGCRFWEAGTNRKMDKDRFRRDLGDVEETYAEVRQLVEGPAA